jgi:16S rRNA U1498 N3-methylase RsmE
MALAAGWQAVDLGSRILRVETAAVALAALVIHGNRISIG